MLFAHLSAGMQSSPSASGRRARAYRTIRARRLSWIKDISIFVMGLLIWAAVIFLIDPAFLHCNRWVHQSSCPAHSTPR